MAAPVAIIANAKPGTDRHLLRKHNAMAPVAIPGMPPKNTVSVRASPGYWSIPKAMSGLPSTIPNPARKMMAPSGIPTKPNSRMALEAGGRRGIHDKRTSLKAVHRSHPPTVAPAQHSQGDFAVIDA